VSAQLTEKRARERIRWMWNFMRGLLG